MLKRILLPLLALMALTSCSKTFYQIATVGSHQLRVQDDGKYRYDEDALTIDYDFWSKYGKVGFVITNKTDEDLYIDLSRSFLVVNGMTFDYFQNRTYKSEHSSTYVSSSSYGGSNTFAYASGWTSGSGGSYGNFSYGSGSGRSMTNTSLRSSTSSSTSKSGIEIKEKEGVWIPANSSRYFCEFSLLEAPYRKCGFARNPSRRESATLSFSENDSPYTFENRIMVVANGKERIVANSFYIKNFTNIPESEALEEETPRDCSGNKIGDKYFFNKYQANFRFYINYLFGKGSDTSTDRIKEKSDFQKAFPNLDDGR